MKEEVPPHPKLYKLPLHSRLDAIQGITNLEPETLRGFLPDGGLSPELADNMIENVIGTYSLPLGTAVNFMINGADYLVPMAIEEPSVVAGASYMAKLVRLNGGFKAEADESLMIAQIQVLDLTDLSAAESLILSHKAQILEEAEQVDPVLSRFGGGPRDLEIRTFQNSAVGPMLVLHLIIDTVDAMGANATNSMAEKISPTVASLTGGRVHLRILSNLADKRLARASCRISAEDLAFKDFSGEQVRDGVIEAWALAEVDPYRAATHNKGIMNGVDAVLIATGNDWRAVEAGAHAYASRKGRYSSLSEWSQGPNGELVGRLEMPLAVGIIGGATQVHPTAKSALQMMGIESANELAKVVVSVGLAQNLAALRALATEGIQRGHMALHARQLAITAGVEADQIDEVVRHMVRDGRITVEYAHQILSEMEQNQTAK